MERGPAAMGGLWTQAAKQRQSWFCTWDELMENLLEEVGAAQQTWCNPAHVLQAQT